MAAIINFDVSIDPAAPAVTLAVSADPRTITVKVDSIGDFSVSVKPSTGTIVAGALAGGIVGLFGGPAGALLGGGAGVGAVQGVAKLIGDKLPGLIRDGVTGKEFKQTLDAPIGYAFEVEGVAVKVTAQTLSLDTFQGMLLARATVAVS